MGVQINRSAGSLPGKRGIIGMSGGGGNKKDSVFFTKQGGTVANGGSVPNSSEVSAKVFSFILDQPYMKYDFVSSAASKDKNQGLKND